MWHSMLCSCTHMATVSVKGLMIICKARPNPLFHRIWLIPCVLQYAHDIDVDVFARLTGDCVWTANVHQQPVNGDWSDSGVWASVQQTAGGGFGCGQTEGCRCVLYICLYWQQRKGSASSSACGKQQSVATVTMQRHPHSCRTAVYDVFQSYIFLLPQSTYNFFVQFLLTAAFKFSLLERSNLTVLKQFGLIRFTLSGSLFFLLMGYDIRAVGTEYVTWCGIIAL